MEIPSVKAGDIYYSTDINDLLKTIGYKLPVLFQVQELEKVSNKDDVQTQYVIDKINRLVIDLQKYDKSIKLSCSRIIYDVFVLKYEIRDDIKTYKDFTELFIKGIDKSQVVKVETKTCNRMDNVFRRLFNDYFYVQKCDQKCCIDLQATNVLV